MTPSRHFCIFSVWDWVVAICLLFSMQYIMSFSNFAVKKVIDIVDTTKVDADQETNVTEPEAFVIEDVKKAKKAYEVLFFHVKHVSS